ncbi:hypothetical protein OROHE_015648 [Orobanche hederae]
MQPVDGEFSSLNPLLTQHQISSLQEILPHMLASTSHFDPVATSHDDFLEQMLSSVPSFAASAFPWTGDHAPPHFEEQSTAVLASKLTQHKISDGLANAPMLQRQLLSRSPVAANGLHSPTVADDNSFESANTANDASVKALFNGFTGSSGQTSNQPQHFHHAQIQNFGAAGAVTGAFMNQHAAGGGVAATGVQPRQRVRARRGQATDPHSIAERLRRERIAERMKALQELVPNANKVACHVICVARLMAPIGAPQNCCPKCSQKSIDKASMLDEIIDYVKFLQLQVKLRKSVLSMSRLGGAAPVIADMSFEGRSSNPTLTTSSSNNKNEGMTVAEQQVAKLMEEDMGSAMQYLQGKGLCLMPISLATAISTVTTSHSRKLHLLNNNSPPLLNASCTSPASPSISVLTVQSAAITDGELYLKGTPSVSIP